MQRRNPGDAHVSIFSHMHFRSGVYWLLELAMDLETMQLGVYLHHGSPLESLTHVVVEVCGLEVSRGAQGSYISSCLSPAKLCQALQQAQVNS